MNDAQGNDEALIRQVAQGDREALAALYDRYAKRVFSMALRLAQDGREAEEITQAGTFAYQCAIHGPPMLGQVTVQ